MEPLTVAYLLIALGLGLMLAELFVPSAGMLFLACGVCLVVGVVMTFWYGDVSRGMLTLLVVFGALPLVGSFALYLWPRTPMGKRLMLKDSDSTVAEMPVHLELEALRGRYGKATSDLRPSGVADFDGKRIDVMSEGMLIASGTWIRCVDVRNGRVIVRPVDKPDLGALESDDFT